MVIFHSYVSLPEGRKGLLAIPGQGSVKKRVLPPPVNPGQRIPKRQLSQGDPLSIRATTGFVIESSCPVRVASPNSNPFPIKKKTRETHVFLVGISTEAILFGGVFSVFFGGIRKIPLILMTSRQVSLMCNVSKEVETLKPEQLKHFEHFADEPAYASRHVSAHLRIYGCITYIHNIYIPCKSM